MFDTLDERFGSALADRSPRLFVIASLVGVLSCSVSEGQTTQARWSPDGVIRGWALDGHTLYLGGTFGYVGPPTGTLGHADLQSGAIDRAMPRFVGAVRAVVGDGEGGYFVGGDFTLVGNQPHAYFVHLLPDGGIDPRTPLVNGPIHALARSGDRLFLGGWFQSVGGEERAALASIQVSSQALEPWQPRADGRVLCMAVDGERLLVGGTFQSVADSARSGVAAIALADGRSTEWNPRAHSVASIAVDGDRVLLGGAFGSVGGQARLRIAAVSRTTGDVLPFTASVQSEYSYLPSSVEAIGVEGTRVFIGGTFYYVNGQVRSGFAVLDRATGSLLTWIPQTDRPGQRSIRSIRTTPGRVYLGGALFYYSGFDYRFGVIGLDAESGAALGREVITDGSVLAFELEGDRAVVAGEFNSAGGVQRSGMAAMDLRTGRPTAWNPRGNLAAEAFQRVGNRIYVGGQFEWLNGAYASYLAPTDASTGAKLPGPVLVNGGIGAMRASGDTLYLAGGFTRVLGVTRVGFAAIDTRTNTLLPFRCDTDDNGGALELDGDRIYIGGRFSNIGGQQRVGFAAVDRASGTVLPLNLRLNGEVRDIEVIESRLYVVGKFDQSSGVPRRYSAAYERDSGVLLGWNPGPSHWVLSMGSLAGRMYLSVPSAVDFFQGSSLDWNPGPLDGAVTGVQPLGEGVLMVGDFTSVPWNTDRYWTIAKDSALNPLLVDAPESDAPTPFLAGIFPNPLRGSGTVRYRAASPATLRLDLLDVRGRVLAGPFIHHLAHAGSHDIRFDPGSIAPGIYFLRVRCGNDVASKRVLFLGRQAVP